MAHKGADIIVDYLIKEGVPYLFGVCGHGIIGFLDSAFERKDEIKTITTHDERVAGFMADAYYRIKHEPVATYTSCGPGSLNLAMAVASAFQDSSAFLAITGNVPTQQFNRGPFQETGRFFQGDFTSVMRPYVKRSYQAFRPEMLPLMMRQSFSQMLTGRPGPVHLDVPLNVFVEESEEGAPEPGPWRSGISTKAGAAPEQVRRAAEMLLGAQRPVLVIGHGLMLAEGNRELLELAEAIGVPVVTSPLGKGVLDERHALCLGPVGRNGTHAANSATRQADVLLAIGTRFDDRTTSSWQPGMTYSIPPSQLIHVDIDPQEIGRNYPTALGVMADGAVFLQQLIAEIGDRAGQARERNQAWVGQTAQWREVWDQHIAERQAVDVNPVAPDRLVADISAVLTDDTIVLADVGVHHNWLLQQMLVPRNGAFLQAWGFAAMGFGVAGSLGAQFAAPDKPVLAVCGDGGFLMHANAVATAVEYDLPVNWLVWNNNGYGSIQGQQAAFFGADRELGTRFRHDKSGELMSADMAAMAEAMGAVGIRVDQPGDVQGALEAAMASDRPTVVEVRVDAHIAAPATGTWDLPPLKGADPNFGWERA